MKKANPYSESAIVKAIQYVCSAATYIPSDSVKNNTNLLGWRFFASGPWCAHISVTPKASTTAVFSSGTGGGLNG